MRHLAMYGTITSAEAMSEYGIMRLASRICELKKDGFAIDREMKSKKNRYGETVTFAEYTWRSRA